MSVQEELSRKLGERLAEAGKGLSRIVHEQEATFLGLGETVQQAAQQIAGLGNEAQELVRLTTGESMQQIFSELEQEFARMGELCSAGMHGGERELLEKTRGLLHSLATSVHEYARVVRTLQMLGIATRIESARLGADGRGFSTLADDVEKLAGKIVEYSGSLLEQGKRLGVIIADAESHSHDMGSMQDACQMTVSVGLTDGMKRLRAVSEQNRESSMRVDGHLSSINRSMQGVVGSLQFHDIVRQQVEHVVEAIDDMLKGLSGVAHLEESRVAEEFAFVAEVCLLQETQARAASGSLSGAVDSLRDELRSIAGVVREVAHDTGCAVDSKGTTTCTTSVLDAMEAEVGQAAECMRKLAGQGEDMGRTMETVASTVSEMTAFLADIEDVGAEIELIALNASIRAAHTGDKGKALGVLATSIQRLSQDAGTQTVTLADLLRNIDAAAAELKQLALSYLDMSRVTSVKEHLEGLTLALREIGDESTRLFSVVGDACSALAGDMEKRVQGITVDRLVCAALDKGAERLASAAALARQGVPEGTRVPTERLRAMRQRYTMHQERVLHGRHVGEAADSGMGDNIELF